VKTHLPRTYHLPERRKRSEERKQVTVVCEDVAIDTQEVLEKRKPYTVSRVGYCQDEPGNKRIINAGFTKINTRAWRNGGLSFIP
jgi:hypothetical protein